MAVTFDSTFEKGASSQASPFSFASNAGTVTGTVNNNSNRVLIGRVTFEGIASSVVSMAWNSVPMTSIVRYADIANDIDIYNTLLRF